MAQRLLRLRFFVCRTAATSSYPAAGAKLGPIAAAKAESWSDEFIWLGTRNSSAYLAIPAAIDFLERVGLRAFRDRTHYLAQYARRRICELTQLEPIVPDDAAWYGEHGARSPVRDDNERDLRGGEPAAACDLAAFWH